MKTVQVSGGLGLQLEDIGDAYSRGARSSDTASQGRVLAQRGWLYAGHAQRSRWSIRQRVAPRSSTRTTGRFSPRCCPQTRADLSEAEPDGLAMTESVAVRSAIRLAPPPGGWGTGGASRSLCNSLRASSVPHLRAGLRTRFEFRARATVWCHHGDLDANPDAALPPPSAPRSSTYGTCSTCDGIPPVGRSRPDRIERHNGLTATPGNPDLRRAVGRHDGHRATGMRRLRVA